MVLLLLLLACRSNKSMFLSFPSGSLRVSHSPKAIAGAKTTNAISGLNTAASTNDIR